MRASSYIAYAEPADNSGQVLLIQRYTGASDQVSPQLAAYVRSLEAGRPEQLQCDIWQPAPGGRIAAPSAQAIAALKRRGYLTDLSLEDEERLVKLLGAGAVAPSQPDV